MLAASSWIVLAVGPTGFCPFLRCPVFRVRLLRLGADLLASVSLAPSALILQLAFSNDLMDPYVMGVQSGAMSTLAAGLLLLGISSLGTPQGYFLSILGSTLPPLIVINVSKSKEEALLIGLALALSLQGLASILAYMASASLGLPMLPMLLGTTTYVSFGALITGLIVIIILLLLSLPLLKMIYLLEYGEEVTTSFGFNYINLLRFSILISSALAAISVSLCGILPFLGLIGANVGKRVAKYGSYEQLLSSIAVSFIVISIADTVSNSIETPFGFIPVGTLLSLIGGIALATILAKR